MRPAALLLAACVGTTSVVYRPDVVQIVQTDSDKAVQVVSDERLSAHEPRAVPPSAVAAALISSGMFLEDDARLLASPVARHLATMQEDEALRIVAWAEDAPRYYYVLIHGNRLQVTYYAGSTRADDYSGVIPTEAVAITAPAAPAAGEPVPPAAEPPPDIEPAPPSAPPRAMRKRRTPPPGYEPLTETEARRRMKELDEAMDEGLISRNEHRTKRKEILARL